MKRKVKYYQLEDGSEPVSDFIDTLPDKHAARALWEIDLLEKFGTSLRMPYTKSISGKKYKGLFELDTALRYMNDYIRRFVKNENK